MMKWFEKEKWVCERCHESIKGKFGDCEPCHELLCLTLQVSLPNQSDMVSLRECRRNDAITAEEFGRVRDVFLMENKKKYQVKAEKLKRKYLK